MFILYLIKFSKEFATKHNAHKSRQKQISLRIN